MAKFTFRLQSFFELKEKLEDQKKLEYGAAVSALETEKQKKTELVNEKKECIASFKRGISEKINPVSFEMHNQYLELLKKRIKAQELVIIKAEEFVKAKRLELVKAMQERKSLEILRDKAKLEHIKEEQAKEQKLIEEVVTYQFNKKNRDTN